MSVEPETSSSDRAILLLLTSGVPLLVHLLGSKCAPQRTEVSFFSFFNEDGMLDRARCQKLFSLFTSAVSCPCLRATSAWASVHDFVFIISSPPSCISVGFPPYVAPHDSFLDFLFVFPLCLSAPCSLWERTAMCSILFPLLFHS